MLKKTFKYRLYPNKAQAETLSGQLSEASRLYNAALQERIEAYARHRKSVSYYDQAAQLTEIRKTDDFGLPNCHSAQDVLKRLDKAFKAFFRRLKQGQKPGFPRFKSRRRYDSITFPSHGDGDKLLPTCAKEECRTNGKILGKATGSWVHAGTDRKTVAFGHIQLQGAVRLDAGGWCYCAARSFETGLPNIPE